MRTLQQLIDLCEGLHQRRRILSERSELLMRQMQENEKHLDAVNARIDQLEDEIVDRRKAEVEEPKGFFGWVR